MEQHEQYEMQPQQTDAYIETGRAFDILAQHSGCLLYQYNFNTQTIHPWNPEAEDVLAHLRPYVLTEPENNPYLLADCMEQAKTLLHALHQGVPKGNANLHFRLEDGQLRWFHVQYTKLEQANILFSVRDITQERENRLSHMRFLDLLRAEQSLSLHYIEADLTDDRMLNFIGVSLRSNSRCRSQSYTAFLKSHYFGLTAQDCENAHAFYARENLLQQYREGAKYLEKLWRAEKDNYWVMMKTDLIADPMNGHILVFSRMLDVTAQQEELIAISKRADYDSMTGLLRRAVGEERIRRHMADPKNIGGILIVLDLDDLKGINDNLGHAQGDTAITGVSTVLKNHFRSEDVLIRAGGDEFIVYLPGAQRGRAAIERSLATLLWTLNGISIGEHNERTIHCSAGCAVEHPGEDSYDDLFQRADTALYHVKRSGKNSFAFYVPEMQQEDYQFQAKAPLSIQGYKEFSALVMDHSDDISYICDTQTYEVLYLSRKGMDLCGLSDPTEYCGKKCYKLLQGLDQPCSFCTNKYLSVGENYRWEKYNQHFERWFDVTDTLIRFDGRMCRLEVAKDITDWKKGTLSLERFSMENIVLRCLHTLSTEENFDTAVNSFLENIGKYYRADRAYIFEFNLEWQTLDNTYEWCEQGVVPQIKNLQKLPLSVVSDWIAQFKAKGEFSINSLGQERDPNSQEYRILEAQGIESLMAAPLLQKGEIVGFIGVDDPDNNTGNLALLRSVSEFVVVELEKRRLLTRLETSRR